MAASLAADWAGTTATNFSSPFADSTSPFAAVPDNFGDSAPFGMGTDGGGPDCLSHLSCWLPRLLWDSTAFICSLDTAICRQAEQDMPGAADVLLPACN